MLGTKQSVDFVWNGSPFDGNANQVLLGLLNSLGNSYRDFGSFSFADTHIPLPITDDHQSAKVESLSAFDHFGNAVDKHYLVF